MAITMTIFQHHANGVQKVWIRTANAYGMATLQRPRVTRTGVASSASLSKLTELRHKEGFNLTLGITGIRCATAESEKQAISDTTILLRTMYAGGLYFGNADNLKRFGIDAYWESLLDRVCDWPGARGTVVDLREEYLLAFEPAPSHKARSSFVMPNALRVAAGSVWAF